MQSIEFDRFLRGINLSVQGLRILLTTSALAGARAKNEHDRDRSSLIDQVWSIFERDRFVSSRSVYIFDS